MPPVADRSDGSVERRAGPVIVTMVTMVTGEAVLPGFMLDLSTI